jgi:secondary thiamine-phosphate synthase enzyme
MVSITADVQETVSEIGAHDGLCHVWIPHTTAAVIVNENADPDVMRDLLAAYEAMIPKVRFHHAEGNSDAHLLSTLIGPSVTIGVAGGRLQLGTWQGIFFVELDGPRTRSIWITIA